MLFRAIKVIRFLFCVWAAALLLLGPGAAWGEQVSPARTSNADLEIEKFGAMIGGGNFQAAEPLLEAYVAKNPDSWAALYQLGYVYFRLHKIVPSIKVLSRSLSINLHNAEAHKILGYDLVITGEFDLAEREFQEAIRLNPKSVESHYLLGRTYFERGRPAAAAKELECAKELDPSYVKAYHNLGLAYEALNKVELALENFSKALELNAANAKPSAWPYIDFAGFRNRRGEFQDAVDLLNKALVADPSSAEANFEISKAYRGLGRDSESLVALERASALNPSNPDYLYALAQTYRRLGREDDARKALERFTRLKAHE